MIVIPKAAQVMLLLVISLPGTAQVALPSAETPEVRIVTAGQELDLVQRIVSRLQNQTRFQFPRDVRIVLVDRPETINAFADPGQRVIVLTTGIVRFESHAEGQVALPIYSPIGLGTDHGPPWNTGSVPTAVRSSLAGSVFGSDSRTANFRSFCWSWAVVEDDPGPSASLEVQDQRTVSLRGASALRARAAGRRLRHC